MIYALLGLCGVAAMGYGTLAVYDAPPCTMERYARIAQCVIMVAIGATCFAALGMVN